MTPAPAARLAQRVAALRGWRRHLLAFVLGVLVTLGLPPGHLVPLIAVGFTGLLWLLDGAERGRTAFWTGWWFGFGLLLTGLYWISISLFVEIERWWWLLPLAVTFLPAAFSIYTGSMIWALWRLRWGGWRRVAALAVLWVLGEWLRGKLFTGFPWHIVGYAWSEVHPVQQAASVVGAYGMGLLTVLLAGLPALFAWLPPRRALLANAAGLAGLALVAGLGAARLPDGPPPADGPLIRIVQPNIPQAVKLSDEAMRRAFDSLRALSTRPTAAPPAAVVWPETAVPYLLTDEPVLLQWVGGSLPAGSGLVLTGSLRADQGADGRRFYNSLVAVDGGGRPVAAYDKFHLVPFGEFMPLRDILPFEGIAQGNVDFSTGPGPTTLALPGLPPFSPLICYEAIFPGNVANDSERPAWLLNITNDAWFGESAGPHQHYAIAAMRAVEEGLPLVRAANTGISGMVDPYGRSVAWLPLGTAGTLDAALPPPLPPTPYARYGDALPAGLAALILAAAALAERRARRRSTT